MGKRRAARASYSGNSLFGGVGWLFADLMLALAMLFIAATSVGTAPSSQASPHQKPASSLPATPGPKVTASPTVSPGRHSPLPLDLTPVTVILKNIDPSAVLNGDPGQANAIRKAVLGDHRLAGRQAGLVILFGGGDVNSGEWRQLDLKIWNILTEPGGSTGLFSAADPLDYWGGGPLTQFQLNIYLWYKTS